MSASALFEPQPPLLPSRPHPDCRACVIIPARNEEHTLPATLDALRFQVDAHGISLDPNLYEVIVLLNNCSDGSAAMVRHYQLRHPAFPLHYAERSLPAATAHVGTARRMLMDTAYHRLSSRRLRPMAILSTDADTSVAPDWVYRNLDAIKQGAEVVGGVIHLKPAEVDSLDFSILQAYNNDRLYQRTVAHLESKLDPDPSDPWPRHLQHFGASLACTPEIYRRAGGLPPVKPLEDVAFIDALRRVDARIRHAPEVCIFTSARLDGRAEVGLSGQLRLWREAAADNRPQMAQSAAYLVHRFSSLAAFRWLGALKRLPSLESYPECWHQPLLEMHPLHLSPSAFLCAINCNRLIDETFHGPREQPIAAAIAGLDRAIAHARYAKPVPARPNETVPSAATEQFATLAG